MIVTKDFSRVYLQWKSYDEMQIVDLSVIWDLSGLGMHHVRGVPREIVHPSQESVQKSGRVVEGLSPSVATLKIIPSHSTMCIEGEVQFDVDPKYIFQI